MFDQRLLRSNERALRESFPDGDFSDVSIADVTEGPDWMRVHMKYQGTFNVQGESVTSAAQIVLYYHRAGMAVITAACTTEPRDCAQIEPLLSAAERSLKARFAASDLDGVLPASSQCSVETLGLPNSETDSRVRACVYAPGIQLTLTRVDADATIRSLIAERAGPEYGPVPRFPGSPAPVPGSPVLAVRRFPVSRSLCNTISRCSAARSCPSACFWRFSPVPSS